MIQVATENFNSQEDFLGLGKKNKAKRQEKRAARREKREAKREARQGKGLLGKVANRIGIGKEAKQIRKDHKAAKTQIKTTGSYTRGSVVSGTIRKPNTSRSVNTIKPSVISPNPSRGGMRGIINRATGGALPRPVPQIRTGQIQPIKPPPPIQRGATPEQRGGASPLMDSPQEPQNPQLPNYSEMSTQAMSSQAASSQTEQLQAAEGQNAENKKPFNWKLWGGVGGGLILIIVIVLIVVFTKK